MQYVCIFYSHAYIEFDKKLLLAYIIFSTFKSQAQVYITTYFVKNTSDKDKIEKQLKLVS